MKEHGLEDVSNYADYTEIAGLQELVSLAKLCLSEKAYNKVIRIVEQDLKCIADIGLKGESGPQGQDYSVENSFLISQIPLARLPGNRDSQ